MTARLWAALATVYVVWGSTYLGIMVAIRTLPPLLMGSLRFLIAGAILAAWSLARGARPTRDGWRAAFVVGAALLVGGTGAIGWAEQRVDSGVAALLVATMPLWLALLERVFHGRRLPRTAVAGLVVGLAGVAILVGPSGAGGVDVVGAVVCVLAALSWAAGSLYARRAPLPGDAALSSAMQMLAGGALLVVLAVAGGETGHIQHVSWSSGLALAYLVVFGSLVAFSAFAWLLRNADTALVSTYAYANPVVAVLLGAAFLGEPVGLKTLIAGAAIVLSVVLIVRAPAERLEEALAALPEPEPQRLAA